MILVESIKNFLVTIFVNFRRCDSANQSCNVELNFPPDNRTYRASD